MWEALFIYVNALIGLYLLVRLASYAYYKSKHQAHRGSENGTKRKP